MVGHGYDTRNRDDYDTLSHDSLGAPGRPTNDAVRQVDHFRNEGGGGRPVPVVAPRPDGLYIDTGIAPANTERGPRLPQPSKPSNHVVGWRDLPKKDQLLVITLARLSEPLTQTSLQVGIVLEYNRRNDLFELLIADGPYRRICFINYDGVSGINMPIFYCCLFSRSPGAILARMELKSSAYLEVSAAFAQDRTHRLTPMYS